MALTHGKDSAMAQSPCGDQTTAQSLVSRLAGQVRHPKTEPRLGPSPPFEKLIFHPIFWGYVADVMKCGVHKEVSIDWVGLNEKTLVYSQRYRKRAKEHAMWPLLRQFF